MIVCFEMVRISPFPFLPLLDLAAGSLCLRCSSGTTFPHLFSCSVRLQGSRPTFEAPFSFVSLPCTPVINFVLLLFVPVNRRPLCWASSPRSTRLEVFSFVRVDRCLIEWWMSLYYSVIELPAFWLVCRDAPPPSSGTAGGLVVGSLVLHSICLIPSSPQLLFWGVVIEVGSEGEGSHNKLC